MDKQFIQQVLMRHVEDCAEDTVRCFAPLIDKYHWPADVRADVLRAATMLVCDVVCKTAELYREVQT